MDELELVRIHGPNRVQQQQARRKYVASLPIGNVQLHAPAQYALVLAERGHEAGGAEMYPRQRHGVHALRQRLAVDEGGADHLKRLRRAASFAAIRTLKNAGANVAERRRQIGAVGRRCHPRQIGVVQIHAALPARKRHHSQLHI